MKITHFELYIHNEINRNCSKVNSRYFTSLTKCLKHPFFEAYATKYAASIYKFSLVITIVYFYCKCKGHCENILCTFVWLVNNKINYTT